MGEHHQLGGRERKLKAREARTRLEELVGTANIAHNMGIAWRRLVTAQESMGDQYAQEERVVYH